MTMKSEFVICKTVNPEGKTMLVEVTNLMLLEVLFYDFVSVKTLDEVQTVRGWVTAIGGKVYRVYQIPPERIVSGHLGAVYETTVPWDVLETKPQEKQSEDGMGRVLDQHCEHGADKESGSKH